MATHDYVIANASGAAVRADLNNALAAIVSNNSNATEPATMYAYQWWADTNAGILKFRNAANDAWIDIVQLDGEYTTIGLENGSAAAPSLFFKDSGTDTGLLSPGANSVAISTGGTQRVTADSSGRLLINATSSRTVGGAIAAKLQIEGTDSAANTTACSVSQNSNNTTGPRLMMAKSRGTSNGSSTVVQDGDELGIIDFAGADGTDAGTSAARITAKVNGTPGANDMPGSFTFSLTKDGASSTTERLTLLETGQPNFFTDSNFNIRSGQSSASVAILQIKASASSVSTGTNKFIVRADGDCENTNNSYGAISDVKLKENIVDAGSQWDDLKAIKVKKYNFKAETSHGTHTQIGVIAQEIELICPGLVNETKDTETVEIPILDSKGRPALDDDGNPRVKYKEQETGEVTKTVGYSVLYMKAVKALQEAMERIEQLETKVAALEGGAS